MTPLTIELKEIKMSILFTLKISENTFFVICELYLDSLFPTRPKNIHCYIIVITDHNFSYRFVIYDIYQLQSNGTSVI